MRVAAVDQHFAGRELEACRLSASEALSHHARVSYAKLALGLVLFVVGLVTIDLAQGSADALARHGVHVSAIVTNYIPSFRGRTGITVSYSTPSSVETNVTVWVPDLASYPIGQPVEISYDSSDPRRAVLTKRADPGLIGSISLFILFLGLALVLNAPNGFLVRRRARRALAGQATSMLVDTAKLRTSTVARLDDGSGRPIAFTVRIESKWPGDSPTKAIRSLVFRDSEAKHPTSVIVDQATGAVLVGRTTRQAARWLASNSPPSSA